MHNNRGIVEPPVKEAHVGVDLEPLGHLAITIRNHAVRGDNGVALDADTPWHALLSCLCCTACAFPKRFHECRRANALKL